jgi:predicted PurR-regulated permease PerM
MSQDLLLTIFGAVGASMFAIITGLMAWIGSRVISQLDGLDAKLEHFSEEFTERINNIENRVIILETVMAMDKSISASREAKHKKIE